MVNEENSTGFFIACDSPDGKWSGVFEDDGDTGYFYMYRLGNGIQDSTPLYHSNVILLSQDDIEVYWSHDSVKCGVKILGVYRVVMDLANDRKLSKFIDSKQAEGIQKSDWLAGLP